MAADAGALVTVAQLDLVLADLALDTFDAAAGRQRSAASRPAAASGWSAHSDRN